jgi:hypothetical protein
MIAQLQKISLAILLCAFVLNKAVRTVWPPSARIAGILKGTYPIDVTPPLPFIALALVYGVPRGGVARPSLPTQDKSFKVAIMVARPTPMDENVNSSRVIGRQPTLPVELMSITRFTSSFRESPLPAIP